MGSRLGALPPEESDGGGDATSAKGGRDGWEVFGGGGALPDLWGSGGLIGTWENPFEVSGNRDGGDESNPEIKIQQLIID